MSRITLNLPTFLATLRLASLITKNKTHAPIMQAVTLETDGRVLYSRACDFECHLGTAFNATDNSQSQPSVRLAVNAQDFRQMLQALDGEYLNLDLNPDGRVSVSDIFNHEVSLKTELKIEDFPAWNGMHQRPNGTIKLGQLTEALEQAAIASAKESNRFAVAGVLLKLEGKGITVVATDGHRLSKVTAEAQIKNPAEIVLPSAAVKLLTKIKGVPDSEVEIRIEKITQKGVEAAITRACFSCDMSELLVTSEKSFPNYEHVIPSEASITAKLKKKDLIKALCKRFIGRKTPKVRIQFAGGEASIVSVINDAGSEMTERVPMMEYRGAPCEIACNPIYLQDFLNASPSDDLEVQIQSPDRPFLLAGINPPGRFQYVCMPLASVQA